MTLSAWFFWEGGLSGQRPDACGNAMRKSCVNKQGAGMLTANANMLTMLWVRLQSSKAWWPGGGH